MTMKIVFFDVDGTLVDARDDAWKIFRNTNDHFGLGIDSQEQFLALSETNIFLGLEKYCENATHTKQVVSHFLNDIAENYNPNFIPGMIKVAMEFSQKITLAILSSNKRETILRILHNGGITECFSAICSYDEEPSKSTALKNFLSGKMRNAYQEQHDLKKAPLTYLAEEAVLVTDTVGDVREALTAGIRVVAVAWGMHDKSKLLDAGAEYVAEDTQGLTRWLSKILN